MLNQITLEGTICGKERAELRTFPSGDLYLKFSIEWKGKSGKRDVRSFFSVVLYREDAEKFNRMGVWQRGRLVRVYGQLNTWRSKDGKSYTDIVCNRLELVGAAKPPAAVQPSTPAVDVDAVVDDGAVEEEIEF